MYNNFYYVLFFLYLYDFLHILLSLWQTLDLLNA
jgi:hypothetical protein